MGLDQIPQPSGRSRAGQRGGTAQAFEADEHKELEVLPREGVRIRERPPSGSTEAVASVKLRRGQEYFRDAVLDDFGGRCGVTHLSVRELLVASTSSRGARIPPSDSMFATASASLACTTPPSTDTSSPSTTTSASFSPSASRMSFRSARLESFTACAEQESLQFPEDAAPPEPEYLAEHVSCYFASPQRSI